MWSSKQVRPGIWVGFTDTTAGNLAFHVGDAPAHVVDRRSAVEAALGRAGGNGGPLAYMNQVHGNHVAVIDAGHSGPEAPTADAMVAAAGASAAGLAVMVADCVPVVLVGSTVVGEPVLAVAHAGRPGVEQGVIAAVVAQMRRSGAVAIESWLGPSVCGSCYEVPEAMRASVTAKIPEAFATTSWGTPALDLPAAVLAQLANEGVQAHASGICTLEDTRYYSHRRSQRDGETEGRFIGFVSAVPAPPRAPAGPGSPKAMRGPIPRTTAQRAGQPTARTACTLTKELLQ